MVKILSNKTCRQIGYRLKNLENQNEYLLQELENTRENYKNFVNVISEFLEKQEKIIRQEMMRNFKEQKFKD